MSKKVFSLIFMASVMLGMSLVAFAGILAGPPSKIVFPSTQLNDTSVNVLDDYEEGTWVPTLSAITPGDLTIVYGTRAGTYVKIGNHVQACFAVATTTFTHSTASGNAYLSTLPFMVIADTNVFPVGSMIFQGITKAGYTQFAPFGSHGTNIFYLYSSGSGVAAGNTLITAFPTGGSVILNGCLFYRTL